MNFGFNESRDREKLEFVKSVYKTMRSRLPLFGHRKSLVKCWHRAVIVDLEDATTALLLMLLPHLKELVLSIYLFSSTELESVFEALEATKDPENERMTVLSCLQKVACSESRADLLPRAVRIWGMFPSVHLISIGTPVVAAYYPQLGGLTYIGRQTFKYGLIKVLNALPKLRVFTYDQTHIERCEAADPYSTTMTLLDTNRMTLEELIFEVSAEVVFEQPVPSLRQFAVLRRVSIDPILLVNPKDGCVSKLFRILPPSIEVIAVGKSVNYEIIESIFRRHETHGQETPTRITYSSSLPLSAIYPALPSPTCRRTRFGDRRGSQLHKEVIGSFVGGWNDGDVQMRWRLDPASTL